MFIEKDGYKFNYRTGIDLDQINLPFDYYYHGYEFKPTDIVLDIGGHIGTFCIPLANKVKSIVVFEPCRESYDLLWKNMTVNKVNNIYALNCGLDIIRGKSKLYHNTDNLGHSMTNEKESYEEIDTHCFNDWLDEDIDFMKMNCEGMEYELILKTENITKIKAMSISYHNDFNDKYNDKDILKRLEELNYKVSVNIEDDNRGIIYAVQS